ncbi:MAG: ABC transporter ATP-binding protein [Myxococcota bacterium]
MSLPLIRVDGVHKKFCRNLKRSLWYGLTDLAHEATGGRRRLDELRTGEFWVLRDISFELGRGESLGLIGANGAGKTTLLRMLCGLIRPDAGRIAVRGRMQALIALGAGFNPILSGRENITVSGAVLGIPRAEIERKLDEIIDFSGIEEFIDAPVQSYSSGMAVRLGFSVAIHMSPDILLVDEVLAVGDLAFRTKCSQKLGELKDRGVPWILVSHDMGTIRNQTSRVLVLERGRCVFAGPPHEAISRYILSVSESQQRASGGREIDYDEWTGSRAARITGVHLLGADGAERETFRTGEVLSVRIDYEAREPLERPAVGIAFYAGDGTCYTGTNTRTSGFEIEKLDTSGSVCFDLGHLPFLPGVYRVRVDLHDQHMGAIDSRTDAAQLRVDGGAFGAGLFSTQHRWRLDRS